MNIIAHRGFWTKESEKNTNAAFSNAWANGFGIETDIRDYNEQLVISHNIATKTCEKLTDFFEAYKKHGKETVLALNIKADGLCERLLELIQRYEINNYFVFDMSVPEMVLYDKFGANYFSRYSDIEKQSVLYEKSKGIWVDAFFDYNELDLRIISQFIEDGKKVVIVSPELHGMDESIFWDAITELRWYKEDVVYLCTDYPLKAEDYFRRH